jgi:hypothetical protein
MLIRFSFADGIDTLIQVDIPECGHFDAKEVEDATMSFIEQMNPDTTYDEIVSSVMNSFDGITWREIFPYTINV